ncbi:SubName: Full=Uncharacterized protein {ECO:0000313/EMBL:CCA74091.1} [Serendipita indica DSM 11827]|nr:SubName: Full=Uncharacterized protein {ECO:0000313/EMBL:CCA74091.1} [Serendipita indica DSM 11827]
MASSGSEDEKILKYQEELENVNRKLTAVRQETERLERCQARLGDKIQRLSHIQERTNSEKRKGVHLSLPLSLLPPHNEGSLARSRTVNEGSRRALLPSSESIGPTFHRTDTRKARKEAMISVVEEDSPDPGQQLDHDDESNRSIDGSYTMTLKGAQRSPPAKMNHLVTSPASGSLRIDQPGLQSPNFMPTSMPEAQRMKKKLEKMQGFMHYVSFIGVLPNSLAFSGLSWPHACEGQEIGRLVDMIIDHRTNGCICINPSLDPMPSYRISKPARSSRPCSIERKFKSGVSNFVALALLGGLDVTKLYEVWKVITKPIWISTYVVEIDRQRVQVAASIVVATLEVEVARMSPRRTTSTKMI